MGLSLEDEQPLIEALNDTLQKYSNHNHTSNHIIYIITSYIFCNEYYFRRDCHIIDTMHHTITLYLYQSKFCKNLFKLTCPIRGYDFLRYIDSICSVTYNDQLITEDIGKSPIKAWIDTECKD